MKTKKNTALTHSVLGVIIAYERQKVSKQIKQPRNAILQTYIFLTNRYGAPNS